MYLAPQEADNLLRGQKNSNIWLDLVDEDKENLLTIASYAIDGANMYKGKTPQGQELKFPKDYMVAGIPLAIKLATALLAFDYAKDTTSKNIKSEEISKLKVEYFKDVAIKKDILLLLEPFVARTVRLNVR